MKFGGGDVLYYPFLITSSNSQVSHRSTTIVATQEGLLSNTDSKMFLGKNPLLQDLPDRVFTAGLPNYLRNSCHCWWCCCRQWWYCAITACNLSSNMESRRTYGATFQTTCAKARSQKKGRMVSDHDLDERTKMYFIVISEILRSYKCTLRLVLQNVGSKFGAEVGFKGVWESCNFKYHFYGLCVNSQIETDRTYYFWLKFANLTYIHIIFLLNNVDSKFNVVKMINQFSTKFRLSAARLNVFRS